MNRNAVLLLAALLVSPAAADVLVFAGGNDYVELDTPYEVKGRRVVYTEKGGGLRSVALADVDLPRSAALSAAQEMADMGAFVGMKPAGAIQGQVELPADDLPDWLRRTESPSALAWDQFTECAMVGDRVCTREIMSKHGGYIAGRLNIERESLDRRIEISKARATQNVANAVKKIK